MAVNYSVSMMINPSDPEAEKKAYARAQISGEMVLDDLAHMVAMQTTVSRADVYAVLISTVENMLIALQEGKQVDFGDLGKFRIQLSSKGTATAEEFTAANITGANIRFIPGGNLKELFPKLTFNVVPSRKALKAVLRAEKAGESIVDLSKESVTDEDNDGNTDTGNNSGGSVPDSGNTDTGGDSGNDEGGDDFGV